MNILKNRRLYRTIRQSNRPYMYVSYSLILYLSCDCQNVFFTRSIGTMAHCQITLVARNATVCTMNFCVIVDPSFYGFKAWISHFRLYYFKPSVLFYLMNITQRKRPCNNNGKVWVRVSFQKQLDVVFV